MKLFNFFKTKTENLLDKYLKVSAEEIKKELKTKYPSVDDFLVTKRIKIDSKDKEHFLKNRIALIKELNKKFDGMISDLNIINVRSRKYTNKFNITKKVYEYQLFFEKL